MYQVLEDVTIQLSMEMTFGIDLWLVWPVTISVIHACSPRSLLERDQIGQIMSHILHFCL
jgi:hypothetical protein